MPETEIPEPWWIVLADHNKAIRFSFDHSHKLALSFRVFSAAPTWHGDSLIGAWELDGDGGDSLSLDQWEAADCEIEGGLKWDGCINWMAGRECMVHGCGPRHVETITAIFNTVYNVGKQHMDLLGDPAPPLPSDAQAPAPIPYSSAG